MKNINIIYNYIDETPINKRNEYIKIHITDKIIKSNTLYYIASRFKHLLKFKFLK